MNTEPIKLATRNSSGDWAVITLHWDPTHEDLHYALKTLLIFQGYAEQTIDEVFLRGEEGEEVRKGEDTVTRKEFEEEIDKLKEGIEKLFEIIP